MSSDVNKVWLTLVRIIIELGYFTSPRNIGTYELLGVQSVINMNKPLVTIKNRKMSYKFATAEAFWIISGDNSVAGIAPFNNKIPYFSDNGFSFFGAYGPKIIEQYNYVIETLKKDKNTRQAVINIWRETPSNTKDVPCTLSVQFLIRDNCLHCVNTMRSSDIWLGWPYDVFNFSMLSAYVALSIRYVYPDIRLGNLYLNVGSQHLYERDLKNAEQLTQEVDFHYNSINLDDFEDKTQFLHYLSTLRTVNNPNDLIRKKSWLSEMVEWRYGKLVK